MKPEFLTGFACKQKKVPKQTSGFHPPGTLWVLLGGWGGATSPDFAEDMGEGRGVPEDVLTPQPLPASRREGGGWTQPPPLPPPSTGNPPPRSGSG